MKDFSYGFERDHLCVTSVVKYRNCVVDFGPGTAVHYPELNACFLENCNALHFGYAIPISIVPIDDSPDLVELVFDNTGEIDPVVAGYLLQNHPEFSDIRKGVSFSTPTEDEAIAEVENSFRDFTDQFIRDEDQQNVEMKKMATTAKHDHMINYTEPEEDIAAIAKQISDHAEAIYQTWKSKGLAPTEILTCHSNSTAADKFGSTLAPKGKGSTVSQMNSQPANLLGDANKLERLVNNFVVEDKARLAATKNVKAVPKTSSIQYALQKFEKNANPNPGARPQASKPAGDFSYRVAPQPTQISRPVPANQLQYQRVDTIEVILPEEVVHKESPLPHKVTGPIEFNGSNNGPPGVTTWPLKNKAISQDNMKMRKDSLKMSPKNSEEFLNEVQREEERLINALKCGVIINEESSGKGGEDLTVKDGLIQGKKPSSTPILKNTLVNTVNGDSSTASYGKSLIKNGNSGAGSNTQSISFVKNRFEGVAKVQEEVLWRNKEVKEWVTEDNVEKNKLKTIAGTKGRHATSENVPHPELTSQQKQHIRQSGANPVRPFLTRGSVAERVLIFEKCPTELLLDKRRTGPGVTSWRTGAETQSKAQVSTIG